jgi:hypothetical protein
MTQALRFILFTLGLVAVLICLSIMAFGAGATAHMGEMGFDLLSGSSHPPSGPWPASMDSELRFYAPFWGTYGLLLIYMARTWPRYEFFVPFVMALFFLGGIGRLISYFAIGAPHPFFALLMVVELALPILTIELWRRIRAEMGSSATRPE